MALAQRQTEIADFFSKEQERLRNYIRSRLTDMSEMDIEDLLQDLFFNLFNKADISLHIENLAAYIYRSIQNRIIDYLRKKNKALSLDEIIATNEGSVSALGEMIADPRADVEKRLIQQELHDKIFAAINKLESKQKAVWIATEIENYSFRELSLLWDEPIGTLLARKHRALKNLQAALKDYK
jgi:RNA polymerase sigma factor (sigma-70 family)